MKLESALFNHDQRQRITSAVALAESRTACEIVPVVATSSGRYDRAEDLVGLWLVIAQAVLGASWYRSTTFESGSWSLVSPQFMWLCVYVLAMAAAFLSGAILASRIGWLRRLFTPARQIREEVAARARQVFFDQRVHHTAGATGVLIYVSLMERTATVLASQPVTDALGAEFVDALCRQLIDGLRAGDPTAAFCHVVQSAGERLAGPFPRSNHDVDELPDVLVTID